MRAVLRVPAFRCAFTAHLFCRHFMRIDRKQKQILTAKATPDFAEATKELDLFKTEDDIWGKESFQEAWYKLYSLMSDPNVPLGDKQTLQQCDLVGLALASSRVEVQQLLHTLPENLCTDITMHELFDINDVEEIFVHVDHEIEVRGNRWNFALRRATMEDVRHIMKTTGTFLGEDGRSTLPGTLHRIAVWPSRTGEVLGVTMRIGRFIPNASRALLPLIEKGSLLLISPPGTGKTTLLRDLAATLANREEKLVVVVVDSSNEIAGDASSPLPFLGRARRMQVANRKQQYTSLLNVVQNHTPDVVIIDELATGDDVAAAWTIAQRGVKLIATCHGSSLASLVGNRETNLLVGGAVQAFLSGEERRMKKKARKSVLERPYHSPFKFVVELSKRNVGGIYGQVDEAVDCILDDGDPKLDRRLYQEVDLTKQAVAVFGSEEAEEEFDDQIPM